ncbi:MAG: hypothetical protein ABI925_09620 [Verrucomicrobiota bacterium]
MSEENEKEKSVRDLTPDKDVTGGTAIPVPPVGNPGSKDRPGKIEGDPPSPLPPIPGAT